MSEYIVSTIRDVHSTVSKIKLEWEKVQNYFVAKGMAGFLSILEAMLKCFDGEKPSETSMFYFCTCCEILNRRPFGALCIMFQVPPESSMVIDADVKEKMKTLYDYFNYSDISPEMLEIYKNGKNR